MIEIQSNLQAKQFTTQLQLILNYPSQPRLLPRFLPLLLPLPLLYPLNLWPIKLPGRCSMMSSSNPTLHATHPRNYNAPFLRLEWPFWKSTFTCLEWQTYQAGGHFNINCNVKCTSKTYCFQNCYYATSDANKLLRHAATTT